MKFATIILFYVSIVVVLLLHTTFGRLLIESACTPGDFYEGPTCTQFTVCVERRLDNKLFLFDCGPGTYFDPINRICDHDYTNKCLNSGPAPPSQIGAPQGSPGGQIGPPGGAPPGHLGVDPPGQNFPPIPTASVCAQYEVDKTGVYDCPTLGFFQSYANCHTFYRCINSMGCIVKGFYISCPDNYQFDSQWKNCTLQDISHPCPQADDPGKHSSPRIYPVIELTEKNMEKFFAPDSSVYWKFMEFIPRESQRIVYP